MEGFEPLVFLKVDTARDTFHWAHRQQKKDVCTQTFHLYLEVLFMFSRCMQDNPKKNIQDEII